MSAIPIAGAVIEGVGMAGQIGSNIAKAVPTWSEKEEKKRLKTDLKAMDSGSLGLDQAEKNQAIQNAMSAAGQQAGMAQAQVARDSLTDQGSRQIGQYTQAQGQIGKGVTQAGASAASQADAMSAQLAEARRQEIMGRLQQQKESAKQRQLLATQAAYDVSTDVREIGSKLSGSGMMTQAPAGGKTTGPAYDANGKLLAQADAAGMDASAGAAAAGGVM
jgi:hypothetical protein